MNLRHIYLCLDVKEKDGKNKVSVFFDPRAYFQRNKHLNTGVNFCFVTNSNNPTLYSHWSIGHNLIVNLMTFLESCNIIPGPSYYTRTEVLKCFSYSTQLSMKVQLFMKNNNFILLKTLRCCIYPADKCKNANNCWHFNIFEQDKFHAQFS